MVGTDILCRVAGKTATVARLQQSDELLGGEASVGIGKYSPPLARMLRTLIRIPFAPVSDGALHAFGISDAILSSILARWSRISTISLALAFTDTLPILAIPRPCDAPKVLPIAGMRFDSVGMVLFLARRHVGLMALDAIRAIPVWLRLIPIERGNRQIPTTTRANLSVHRRSIPKE